MLRELVPNSGRPGRGSARSVQKFRMNGVRDRPVVKHLEVMGKMYMDGSVPQPSQSTQFCTPVFKTCMRPHVFDMFCACFFDAQGAQPM